MGSLLCRHSWQELNQSLELVCRLGEAVIVSGQELIGIGCLLLLRLSRLTSCCLMVIGIGIGISLFGELF